MTTQRQTESATEIDLLAADWLQRRNFWNWGAQDEAALEAWLSQSHAHRIAYWRQKSVWDNAQRLVALRPLSASHRPVPLPRAVRPLVFKIAAAMIAMSAAGAGGFAYLQTPTYREAVYSTPVGGRETITLFDGSQIELNTDTTLRVRKSATERTAFLEKGEAFFNIKHDATRPFSVTVSGHRVVDLGTKFVVRDMPGRLEVSLLEGSARFESVTGAKSAVLSPGDVVVATAQSTKLTHKSSGELGTELGWRRGLLTFYRATLADAAAEMNRYNERKIVIADAAAAKELIDGTFPANDVDLFGRMAHSVLGLRVRDKGDGIVISR
jgi:transmembrane sensor